jgi:hypothetical protein
MKNTGKIDWRIVFILYICVTLPMLFFHEQWRDEMQALTLVRSCSSIFDIPQATRYEGHPLLWFILLYIINSFTSSIFTIQLVHWLIMTTGVFVFLRYASLDFVYKVLIIFGYYFVFEYTAFFRNYAAGITLLFIAMVLLQRQKLVTAAAFVFLALQANIFAVFLGIALWFTVSLYFYRQYKRPILIGSLIVMAGVLISFFYMIPPADTGINPGIMHNVPRSRPALIFWNGLVPLSKTNLHFWNKNIIQSNALIIVAAVVTLYFCLLCIRRSFFATLFFIVVLLQVLPFTFLKFSGSTRHHGHILIAFIMALWLSKMLPRTLPKTALSNWYAKIFDYPRVDQVSHFFLLLLFIANVFAGTVASYFDYRYSFSKGREVAGYLRDHQLANHFIISDPDEGTSTIAMLLGRKFYSPLSDLFYNTVTWNNKRKIKPTHEQVLHILQNKRRELHNVLLITSYPVMDTLLQQTNTRLLTSFKPAIEATEEFYLYQ